MFVVGIQLKIERIISIVFFCSVYDNIHLGAMTLPPARRSIKKGHTAALSRRKNAMSEKKTSGVCCLLLHSSLVCTMFADELKTNASRKRAEANKAKRRQLKQKQDAKRSGPTTNGAAGPFGGTAFGGPAGSSAVPTTSSSGGLFGVPVASQPAGLKAPSVVAQEESLSAVEKAKILREKRAQETKMLVSALSIQSFYRCWKSNKQLQTDQKDSLRRRISDVASLAKILKEKKGISFVPPPATTTALTQQLLWLAKTIPYGKRLVHIRELSADVVELLNGLLNGCIIPSVLAADDDSNPLINWVESSEGKQRLTWFLRLMICVLVDSTSSLACVEAVGRSINEVTSPSGTTKPSKRRASFLKEVRKHLVCSGSDPVCAGATKEERMKRTTPFSYSGTPLDLIGAVRYYLMFVGGGPDPIPSSASDRRETSISNGSRSRGGTLFRLVWTMLKTNTSERARAFAFLWTVPLLSWKLSDDTLTLVVEPARAGARSPMEEWIRAFIDHYTQSMLPGSVESFLPATDVKLTVCPATTSQCLLANVAQIGRLCKAINGSDSRAIDFDFAVIYFDLVAMLLDSVPLSTLFSRESSVEWITDGKGHHTPVVISSVVLDQCKALTVDSYVRRLFHCAIDVEYFETEKILATKTDEDRKLENDMFEVSGASNAALAAKEARVDRNKPFWASSKWARRMTKNVTNLLSGDGREKPKDGPGRSGLINSSSVSAKLARGEVKASDPAAVEAVTRRADFHPGLLLSLCRAYSVILARWGGGGGTDITGTSRDESLEKVATKATEAVAMSLLTVLAFSTPLLRVSWGLMQSDAKIKQSVARLTDADRGGPEMRTLHCVSALSTSSKRNSRGDEDALSLLYLFVSCLCHTMIITDDVEIHDLGKPLPLHQLRRVILHLKKLLYKVCCVDAQHNTKSAPSYVGCAMISSAARAMSDLYNRSSRRPLCLPKVWLVSDLLEKELRSCKTHADYLELLSCSVLRVCPQLVSFKRRLKLFERIVYTNRIEIQGENSSNPFHSNPLKPARVAVIHRNRILEDGLGTMNNLGANMRQRISVHYVSEAGHKETGVDAGGLFKDFWTDLCAIAFDPNYALFAATEGAGNCLFPSPLSYSAHGIDHLTLFGFLGRIL